MEITDIQVGGLERAFAISAMLAITVLIPFPFPSTCTFFTIHVLPSFHSKQHCTQSAMGTVSKDGKDDKQ